MDTLIEISDQSIDPVKLDSFLRAGEGGGVCLFTGTTRRVTDNRVTLELSYEAATELAVAEISRLIEDAKSKWPLLRIVVVHRLGTVAVGEASVAVGVCTPHRGEAFEACRFLIDMLKQRVPIWKKEIYEDGSTEWVRGQVPS